MKWYCLITVFIFFNSILCYCQIWPKSYFTDQSSYPYDIIESYDHGYIIGGGFYSNSNAGSGLIFKTDVNGELLWYHSIGSLTDGTIVTGLDQTKENGLIMTGYTEIIADQWNPFIMKINPCGEKEWCHLYPSENNIGWGRAIKTLSDSSYIALIVQYGDDIDEKRVWLFHLGKDGDLLWQKYFGQSDSLIFNEWSSDLLITKDSSIIITGDCYYPEPGQSGGWHRPFIFKTNNNGELEWETPWTNNEFFIGYSYRSIVDNHGKIYSTCRHSRQFPPYGASPTLIFTDSCGTEVGYQDLITDSYLAAATTINWFQDSTIAFAGGWTMQGGPMNEGVFRTDQLGNIIKSRILFESESSFNDAINTYDNKIVLIAGIPENSKWNTTIFKINDNLDLEGTNTTQSFYDSLCPTSITNNTIFLDCDNIVEISEPLIQNDKSELKILPNPATNYFVIELPKSLSLNENISGLRTGTYYYKWYGAEIVIYNFKGEVNYSKLVDSETIQQMIDVSNWTPGMYLIHLKYKNKVVSKSKVIILSGN